MSKLDLQRGLPVFSSGERIRDLAHFRIHPCGGNDGAAAAIYDRAPHVDHVVPVAQRDVRITGINGVCALFNRNAFAGQRSFFGLHAGGFQDACIRRDGVAGFKNDHIARNKQLAFDGYLPAVAQNLACCRGHRLERFDCFFSLAFLIDAQHCVDEHND